MANMDDELGYYEKRLHELDGLLSLTDSQTFTQFLSRARAETVICMGQLAEIGNVTVSYLTIHDAHVKKRLQEFKEYIDLYNLKITEVNLSGLTGDARESLATHYENLLEQVIRQLKLEEDVHKIIIVIYPQCYEQFKTLLLNHIYKPNNSSFNYESVIDILNMMASAWIPGLETLKSVKQLIPSIRKKEFARSGDKVLLYLEQYLDVLEQWKTLGAAYIAIVVS